MGLKDNFMLREIAGTWVVVPIGQRVIDFNGLINLSETGAFIWSKLSAGETSEEILLRITEAYDIDIETAAKDMDEFLSQLKDAGIYQ